MEIKESSPYVKAKAVLLAEYFAQRNWMVVEGKNDSVLLYIPSDQICDYTLDELADIIAQSDFHITETGLRMTSISYTFFHRGKFYKEVVELPTKEFDFYR